SLRIGALAVLAAVGALKLAQHLAAGSQAERIVGALAPSLRLSYSGVAGALDGRVILESPRLEVLAGPAKGAVVRAARATIEPPGTFWLLQRIVMADASVPRALDLRLEGTSFSQEAVDRYAREGWFGTTSLVPFETLGCEPVTAFSSRDYARMGMTTYPREDQLRYAYDPEAHTLRADLTATAAPFSTITAHLDLSAFEPGAWFGNARAAKAERIEQLALTWLDGGYLAKRNRFCAQLTGTDALTYADRHLAAVKTFLEARGIVPGDDVANLYRKLVAEGGSAEISSLPEAAFAPADFAEYEPEDLLRQLNVTLRRNTAPPILMRLAFTAPAEPADADIAAALASVTPPAADAATSATIDPDAVEMGPEYELPATVVHAEPSKGEGMPLLSVANAAALPIETPAAPMPQPPPETVAVAASEETAPTWAIATHPSVDPRDAVEAIPASAPPPPPDSTAALVWRAPTIERLAERTVQPSAYVAIAPSSLGANVGARVRLLTAGGKRVEGRLKRLDGGDVVVLVLRDGGSAEMRIPAAGIRGAEVRRSVSP
ncbi:MAG TPA: hypothetical protein VFL30_03715, partial [Rhodanobacteraceae bacterium]|nr:hypothetical protein [Rhodanobacteraceae bacterium]